MADFSEGVELLELCTCKHTSKTHTPVFGVPGQGRCVEDECECEQFTWLAMVQQESPQEED